MANKKNNLEQSANVEKKTKQSYVKELRKMLTEGRISDESLKSKVESTLTDFDKDMTKVSKTTIVDLCNEVITHMTATAKVESTPEQTSFMETPAPVEASLKPKKGKKTSKKTEETPAEEVDETPTEEETSEEETPAEKPAKKDKKSTLKKPKEKKTAEVESLPAASNVGADFLPSAKMFPAEIEHADLGKLVACTGAYTSYGDILKALEEDKTLYFAAYWTKRHVKEYQYAQAKMIDPKKVKNGFPHDLDILTAVLPCETMERLYALSLYTEALFQFEGEDLHYVEDTDPRSGNKFRVRVSAGMEFEIYRPADEEIVTAK